MKSEKIAASWNKLNPSEERKERMLNKINEKQNKRRPAFRPIMAVATAAVICLAIFGYLFLAPNDNNVFSIKAYALEELADGIGLREIDLINQPEVWGGHYDGEYFYVSVGLQCEGENIKSVEFKMENGVFARQYISDFKDGENVSRLYVGADSQLVMVGEEFEILGSEILLDEESMTKDMLLFCALEIPDINSIPEKIEIVAIATFNDGTTQEKTLTIGLSGTGAYTHQASDEEIEASLAEYEYYMSLPLELCELIPETVKTVTDIYYEVYVDGEFVFSSYVDREHMEFDENGIYRGGCGTLGLEGMNIEIFELNDSGEIIGMIYHVPEDLLYAAD